MRRARTSFRRGRRLHRYEQEAAEIAAVRAVPNRTEPQKVGPLVGARLGESLSPQ